MGNGMAESSVVPRVLSSRDSSQGDQDGEKNTLGGKDIKLEVISAFPFLGALGVAMSLEKESYIPIHGGSSARTLCEGPAAWASDMTS